MCQKDKQSFSNIFEKNSFGIFFWRALFGKFKTNCVQPRGGAGGGPKTHLVHTKISYFSKTKCHMYSKTSSF